MKYVKFLDRDRTTLNVCLKGQQLLKFIDMNRAFPLNPVYLNKAVQGSTRQYKVVGRYTGFKRNA